MPAAAHALPVIEPCKKSTLRSREVTHLSTSAHRQFLSDQVVYASINYRLPCLEDIFGISGSVCMPRPGWSDFASGHHDTPKTEEPCTPNHSYVKTLVIQGSVLYMTFVFTKVAIGPLCEKKHHLWSWIRFGIGSGVGPVPPLHNLVHLVHPVPSS